MVTIGEIGSELGPDAPVSSADEVTDAWEHEFIDDLIAANRLKNFLVTQGVEIPDKVLEGLAFLSDNHRREMNEFVEAERRKLRRKSLFHYLFPWSASRAEPL